MTNKKTLKDMSFQELVDAATQEIHSEMLEGKYIPAVRRMMNMAVNWAEAQKDNQND